MSSRRSIGSLPVITIVYLLAILWAEETSFQYRPYVIRMAWGGSNFQLIEGCVDFGRIQISRISQFLDLPKFLLRLQEGNGRN